MKLTGVSLEDFNNGQTPPLHWPVTDAGGNSVVVEYVDGQLKIWDNRSNGVLTNEPNLGWHLDNLRCFYSNEIKGSLGSDLKGLPGDYSSAGRFVKNIGIEVPLQSSQGLRRGPQSGHSHYQYSGYPVRTSSVEHSDTIHSLAHPFRPQKPAFLLSNLREPKSTGH